MLFESLDWWKFCNFKRKSCDIDLLTEFDGLKVDKLGIWDEIEDIIYNAPLRTNGCCHSFLVYNVPKSYGNDYNQFVNAKFSYLNYLFPKVRNSKGLKGFIKLKGGIKWFLILLKSMIWN